MKTLIQFHIGSYKSTKEAVNVALGLGYIFLKHPPRWNTWEQLWKSSRNCAGEENGDAKAVWAEKMHRKSFRSETAKGGWWK